MSDEILVVAGAEREALLACLEQAGVACRAVAAVEVLRTDPQHPARVVCGREPGWEALVASVAPRGTVVLVGPPPSPDERRRMAGALVEVAAGPEGVVDALQRAALSARERRSPLGVEAVVLVNEIAQAIARQGDLSRVISEAIARTQDLCEADGASLLLVDADTGELHFEAVAGDQAEQLGRQRLRQGQGIAGKVARSGTSLCVSDVRLEPAFDSSCDDESGFRTGSIIAVPLHIGGDLVGVLEAVRGRERVPLGEGQLRRLELLAPHVAIAVHNGQITTELRSTQAQVLLANQVLEQKVFERTRQISEGKREWEQTFDAISEPIALQDGYTVRRANLAYAKSVGVPIRDVPGRPCYGMWAGRSSPCPGCPIRHDASGPLNAEIHFGERVVDLSAFTVEGGREGTRVVHYRDVTHERALEDRLRETERLAAVGQLASGAAHEINNPLAFVSSNLQSLRSNLEELTAASRGLPRSLAGVLTDCTEMVQESLDGARRVAEIVRGLRELARLEIGERVVTRLADCATRAVRAELEGWGRVELDVPADLTVRVAPLQFDQALGHILRNARQAVSPEGRITIRAHREAGEVHLQIQDDGCGIAPEHLRRVFEPFFTTRGVGKGVGLGLTAAWGIVTRFGGRLEVESIPGKGAKFIIQMPGVQPDAEVLDASDEPEAALG